MSNEELASLIQQGRQDLIPDLWNQIEGFVRYMAVRLIHKLPSSAGVELDDLVNSGYFALLGAIKYYDSSEGSFTTILAMTLKTAFAEAFGGRTKRQQLDPLLSSSTRSLDAPMGNDDNNGVTLLDFVPDSRDAFANAEESIYNEQLHNALEETLSHLLEEEADVLRKRFYDSKTLQEISMEDGRSPERIRQVECQALRRIRRPKNIRPLKSFWLEQLTPYYMHVGVQRFQTTQTSATEAVAIWRDEQRHRHEGKQ